MKPSLRPTSSQLHLFQAHFDQLLNPNHPLVVLAKNIDWNRFQLTLEECYCPELGAPAKSVRVIVGLLAFNLSDDGVLERWVVNPYWQYFCGFETMQYEPPIHSTSLTKWRNRVGAERLSLLLQETIELAVNGKQITKNELAQVTIDTTVQKKNITYPTDSKLYHRAIVKLARAAANRGNWIVGVQVSPGNPYDGHTLASTILVVEKTTGVKLVAAFVDKGYRGHDYQGEAKVHISGTSNRDVSRAIARRRRRRSAIEPTIGHMNSENRFGRCYLSGLSGDRINAVLAAAGSNLLKLLKAIAPALKNWLVYRLVRAILASPGPTIELRPT